MFLTQLIAMLLLPIKLSGITKNFTLPIILPCWNSVPKRAIFLDMSWYEFCGCDLPEHFDDERGVGFELGIDGGGDGGGGGGGGGEDGGDQPSHSSPDSLFKPFQALSFQAN